MMQLNSVYLRPSLFGMFSVSTAYPNYTTAMLTYMLEHIARFAKSYNINFITTSACVACVACVVCCQTHPVRLIHVTNIKEICIMDVTIKQKCSDVEIHSCPSYL